jgi:hypothetical protein
MKKIILLIAVFYLLVFISFQAVSESVSEEELLTTEAGDTIVFKNYSGPHKKINTVEQIVGIGRILGADVGRDAGEFSYFSKYRIIHAVDYTKIAGLDADILILSSDAAVDHITNLRRIISGYLEAAYDYSREQADTLSVFITVYNAVHRNNMEYFGRTYKKIVNRNLTQDKAGLALSYTEWPGRTMIVIPLTPQAGTGTIGDLDSDILSGEDVVKQLREEDGKGIEPRRELVELKEDEVLEDRKEIEAEREELKGREEEVEAKIEELKEDGKDADAQEIKEAEKELEEITEAEAIVDEKERQVEEREERIVAEREAIAEDQMDQINRETADESVENVPENETEAPEDVVAPPVGKMTFLLISGGSGSYTGQLVVIETESGRVLKRSDVDSIRLRGYSSSKKEIISVAGEAGGNRIVSIVKIDPESLDIIQSGTVEVYIDSALVKSGDSYYAVVQSAGKWKLGIFNKNLELESISAVEVFPATEIYIVGNEALVQDVKGKIIRISSADFAAVD